MIKYIISKKEVIGALQKLLKCEEFEIDVFIGIATATYFGGLERVLSWNLNIDYKSASSVGSIFL